MGGGSKQLTSLYINKDGSSKALSNAYGNINGSSKEIFNLGTPLVDISIGSIVKFNTTLSGTNKLTDFIVLGTSYNNDTILLLQRYSYGNTRVFDSNGSPHYYDSSIDKYLSADASASDSYRSKLDSSVRSKLVKTEIMIQCIEDSAYPVIKELRDIFLLSMVEVGWSIGASFGFGMGKLYLDALKIATGETVPYKARQFKTEDGNGIDYWLRDERSTNKDVPYSNYYNGNSENKDADKAEAYPIVSGIYVRPALSFSKSTAIDKNYQLI